MKKETTVKVLRVLTVIVGVCLGVFNPDLNTVVNTTKVDVVIVRIAGVVLVLVGVFLPMMQGKLAVVGRSK